MCRSKDSDTNIENFKFSVSKIKSVASHVWMQLQSLTQA